MPAIAISKFERFFREAAGLDVDKDDVKRYSDFVYQKLYDLLLMAQATAKANLRDIFAPWDLPITKGLQESTHQFRRLDQDVELQPILHELAARPPLDLQLGEETEQRLPELIGGMSLALAHTFKIIDPDVVNPRTEHWERAFQIFNRLL